MSAVAATAVLDRLKVSTTCPGCGLALPVHGGPTHAYVGASAACWRLFSKLSTDPFARREGTRLRRLVVDAYAAQHPGTEHRRATQSVAVHLMGLCVLLERDGGPRRPAPVPGRTPARKTMDLHWLAPPAFQRCMSAADVLAAGPGDAYAPAAEAWAKSVWAAWKPHHETVRGWLDAPCRQPDG
jgi:hypothetical protein